MGVDEGNPQKSWDVERYVGWPLSSGRTRDDLDGAGGSSLMM